MEINSQSGMAIRPYWAALYSAKKAGSAAKISIDRFESFSTDVLCSLKQVT